MKPLIAGIVLLCCLVSSAAVIPSETDHVVSLDGTWRFKLEQAKGKYDQRGETGKIAIDYPEKVEPFYAADYKEGDGWSDITRPALGAVELHGRQPPRRPDPDPQIK